MNASGRRRPHPRTAAAAAPAQCSSRGKRGVGGGDAAASQRRLATTRRYAAPGSGRQSPVVRGLTAPLRALQQEQRRGPSADRRALLRIVRPTPRLLLAATMVRPPGCRSPRRRRRPDRTASALLRHRRAGQAHDLRVEGDRANGAIELIAELAELRGHSHAAAPATPRGRRQAARARATRRPTRSRRRPQATATRRRAGERQKGDGHPLSHCRMSALPHRIHERPRLAEVRVDARALVTAANWQIVSCSLSPIRCSRRCSPCRSSAASCLSHSSSAAIRSICCAANRADRLDHGRRVLAQPVALAAFLGALGLIWWAARS